MLSHYLAGQSSFLLTLDLKVTPNLAEKLFNIQDQKVHRHTLKINLDDFSEVGALLDAHLENY